MSNEWPIGVFFLLGFFVGSRFIDRVALLNKVHLSDMTIHLYICSSYIKRFMALFERPQNKCMMVILSVYPLF